MRNPIWLLFLTLFLASCTTIQNRPQFTYEPGAISVMAYNTENLFDTLHDEGTEDYSYLPASQKKTPEHIKRCQQITHTKYRNECLYLDWNEEVLKRKMSRLAEAILQVNDGRGPDLLIVEEVENQRVLDRLNKEYLTAAGYTTAVVLEGFDKRGIDVGFLTRLKSLKKPILHRIPYKAKNQHDAKWMARSRGILEGTFELPDGTPLTAFAVHFPSPSNPLYWRKQAIAFLNQRMQQLPPGGLAIAGGDFNISSEEDRRHQLYKNYLGKQWLVSHRIGCQGCRGTNYWHTGRSWSFLDALLFKKSMAEDTGHGTWYVDSSSIGIPKYSLYQTNRWLSPARFGESEAVGVSDHWPIFAVIKMRKPQSVSSK